MLGTYGDTTDFFKLKGDVEAIFNGLNLPKVRYTAESQNPSYHPGRCAALTVGDALLGYIGQIHPLAAKNYGLDCAVYCAEINFTLALTLQLPDSTYTPLPKYPSLSRDLAIVCDENITVAQVEDEISAAAGKILRNTKLFDIYRGAGVPENKKSMAFNLELRADDKTLTDSDCEKVIERILSALSQNLNAVIR